MPQSIILLSDVPGLGQIGEQKKVKEGYARNYLFPKGLAVLATANAVKRAERQKSKIEEKRVKLLEKAKKMADKVAQVGLVFEKPVGQNGRLFGSVTHMDIVDELSGQGAKVEKRSVLMNGPLKTPGEHQIKVRIHSQIVVDVPVKIVGISSEKSTTLSEIEPEEQSPAEEEKPEE